MGQREKRTPKSLPPLSLRLTQQERDRLKLEAGQRSLSAYIRARLFDEKVRTRATHLPNYNEVLLASILAQLGDSHLSQNLHDLAEAAQAGILPLTEETENTLQTACHAVTNMRNDLICALGLKEGPEA
jgi:hypothetical protein